MSDDVKVELDDMLAPGGPDHHDSRLPDTADAAAKPPAQSNDRASFEIVAALATRYGVPFNELAAEIEGRGILATIARDLLGWAEMKKPVRGRPPKTEEKWRKFVFIELCRAEYGALKPAIDAYIQRSGQDEDSFEKLRREHERSTRKWSAASVPKNIADMFAPPPPDAKGQKEI